MQSPWRTLLEHIELMPKDQDFRFQPASRLEAVAQRTDEKESNCDHQPQACSDSLTTVTPADGVFGSDRIEPTPNQSLLQAPKVLKGERDQKTKRKYYDYLP